MSDLKLCPFCGGEAEMLTAESMNGGYLFGIMCNDCRSRGDVYDTEAEAIAAWNSRAERTCKWEYPQSVNGWVGYTVCSSCGEKYDETVTDSAHYCPSCGSKVMGE